MKDGIKILVVEDEYITAKTLSIFLEESGYDVVGCAMDANEALLYLKNDTVDCIILDINLNDVKDGVWIANHVKKNYDIPFVYLTAYTDKNTVSKAIETSPYGFLAKPFQKTELFTAIEIALYKHNELSMVKKKFLSPEDKAVETVFLKNIDRFDRVVIDDIYFIESQKNYLLVHTNEMVYKHRATIKDFYELLPSEKFIKTHRAFLININKIHSVDKTNNLITTLNINVPISKAYKQEVLAKINLF